MNENIFCFTTCCADVWQLEIIIVTWLVEVLYDIVCRGTYIIATQCLWFDVAKSTAHAKQPDWIEHYRMQ